MDLINRHMMPAPTDPRGLSFAETCHYINIGFDREYYTTRYPDMAEGHVDPLEHYALFGWRENRDPCFWFSTQRYLAAHSDVARMDVNPLLHYILCGHREGRAVWPANCSGPIDLKVDPSVMFIYDHNLRMLTRYPPRKLRPPPTNQLRDTLTLHWVIPDFSRGGGGHMTIFRMIYWLEILGHDCYVWINYPYQHTSAQTAYENITKFFLPIRAPVAFADDGFATARGDVVIATGWETVTRVLHATDFRDRFYFVQDYEPAFHPIGSHALVADWTYRQELACICAGPWLAHILRHKYGRWVRHFALAYDPDIYHSVRPSAAGRRRVKSLPRIALYARADSPRRAVELALVALEHVASRVKFHLDLFGAEHSYMCAPFPCTSHGILSPQELAELYRRAEIGICFSSTNYSLVPQEMMACGLPVIELEGESTRSVFPPEAVTFTGPHPLAIANDIVSLLNSPARRKQQATAALRWVCEFNWEKSAKVVERAFFERLRRRGQKMRHRRTPTKSSPMATVCIPTYNGGELLVDVVERVLNQRAPWPFDIVIVDSSSCDGSIGRCESIARSRNANLRVKIIDKSKFQHGRTRNLCVDLAVSEFVCFLTQDAQPTDEFWLYNLVNVVGRFPHAAGGFGRHIPWPNASPFTKRDIEAHFSKLSQYPLVLSRDTNTALWQSADEGWLQTVHYFSDNNSCIRRSVWEQAPFPEIDYGEDQAWADKIIRLGFEKAYVPAAAVYHSHDWSPREACQRAETEAYYFSTVFGYRLYDLNRTFEEQLEELHSFDRNWARQKGLSAQCLEHQLVLDTAILTGRANGTRRAVSGTTDAERHQE